MVEDLKPVLTPESVIVADAGYHSEANLAHLAAEKVEAYIADRGYRERDERYAGQVKHKATDDAFWDKTAKRPKKERFPVTAFTAGENWTHAVCPAWKKLYRSGGNCNIGGQRAIKFKAAQSSCANCPLRQRCLREPTHHSPRSMAVFIGEHATPWNVPWSAWAASSTAPKAEE